MQAFLFYIDDWLSSKNVEMMDAAEERGYLRLLLREAKEDDCSLPDDDTQLAIMSMLGTQWNKPTADKTRRIGDTTSGQKLRKCFRVSDGKLYNERLLKEFENQKRVREARAAAGRMGGRPQKQLESNSFSNGLANGKQTERSPSPNYKKEEETSFASKEELSSKTGAEVESATPKNGSAPKDRGTRFKECELPEKWHDWASKKSGWDEDKISREYERFSFYWGSKAGPSARKTDWYKTWQGWCSNDYGGQNGVARKKPTRQEEMEMVFEKARNN